MDSLKGQIALVTGASRGLGRAIAIAFAEAGADVAINYNQRSSEAEKTADDVRSFGRRAIIIQADVANTACIRTSRSTSQSEKPSRSSAASEGHITEGLAPLVEDVRSSTIGARRLIQLWSGATRKRDRQET